MVSISKRLAAARTLPRAVRDQVLDTVGAECVAAEFHRRVADVGVADGADGDFLYTQNDQYKSLVHSHAVMNLPSIDQKKHHH